MSDLTSKTTISTPRDEFLIPAWRVQQVLRHYADAMERGEVPARSAPDALRQAALMMSNVT